MKISVITACLNSSKTIADCLDSVSSQNFPDVEHVIVDGESADGTLGIIQSRMTERTRVISEKDNGLYDAMNKGISAAGGDVIGILNSDDLYIDEYVLSDVSSLMEKTGADTLYADLFYVYPGNTDKILRYWNAGEFIAGSFARGWHPPHPTFFVRKEIYLRYGLFDTKMKVSADFELMLRFLERHRISTCYLPRPIIKMRQGGESSGSLRKIITGNVNCYRAFHKNGIRVSPFYFCFRLAPKIVQVMQFRKFNPSETLHP